MYRNAWWSNKEKCVCLRTWNEQGERVTEKVPFSPYLYIESPRGKYESIFGGTLVRKDFKAPFDRTLFIRNYGSKRIYENFDTPHQFLLDKYWKYVHTPDFDKNPLRILFYDIEVDPLPDGEFPTPEEAKAEINLITFYDSLKKRYFIFSKKPYSGNNLGDDTDYIECDSEAELLQKMIEFWQSDDYPDIVSAWNSNNFDFPYIRNRIIKVLGEEEFLKFSPYGVIKEVPSVDKMQHEYMKYDVAGITNIDFIDVYIRFKQVRQESYKLDFIAHQELGIGKVDYDYNIQDFMVREWNKFVEYNKRDVELLVLLEEKLNYFKILQSFAYGSCINFEKAIHTIPVVNGALAVTLRPTGKKLHSFKMNEEGSKLTGGYVHAIAGLFQDIVTFDATSLYPSIIITNNISPETKVATCVPSRVGCSFYEGQPEDEFVLKLTNGKDYKVTRKKLNNFLKKQNLVLCPNGVIFSMDVQGVLPQWVESVYNKRQEARAMIKDKKQELAALKQKLKILEDYGTNVQRRGVARGSP